MTHTIVNKVIFSISSHQDLQFDTKCGYIHRLTPSKGRMEAGGDQFMSYNVQALFKTFNLIPNMATFRG